MFFKTIALCAALAGTLTHAAPHRRHDLAARDDRRDIGDIFDSLDLNRDKDNQVRGNGFRNDRGDFVQIQQVEINAVFQDNNQVAVIQRVEQVLVVNERDNQQRNAKRREFFGQRNRDQETVMLVVQQVKVVEVVAIQQDRNNIFGGNQIVQARSVDLFVQSAITVNKGLRGSGGVNQIQTVMISAQQILTVNAGDFGGLGGLKQGVNGVDFKPTPVQELGKNVVVSTATPAAAADNKVVAPAPVGDVLVPVVTGAAVANAAGNEDGPVTEYPTLLASAPTWSVTEADPAAATDA